MKPIYRTDRFHEGGLISEMKKTYRTDLIHEGGLENKLKWTMKSEKCHQGILETKTRKATAIIERYHVGHLQSVMKWTYKTTTEHTGKWEDDYTGIPIWVGLSGLPGSWTCCKKANKSDICNRHEMKDQQVVDYKKWSGCKCMQGATGCKVRYKVTGRDEYRQYSICGHLSSEPPCSSKEVRDKQIIDYKR